MRKQVDHRLIGKARLIEVEGVLRESAGIHNTELRRDRGPGERRGLASVVKARPDKYSCEIVVLACEFPGLADALTPRNDLFVVVSKHLLVLAVTLVASARGNCTVVLRTDDRLLGVLCVHSGNILDTVVYTRNVHLHSRAFHSAVDRAGDESGIVEMLNDRSHSAIYSCALLGVLERLFVKERPEYYRGVIAVAADHYLKVLKNLLARLKATVLVHNDHTELVARVKNFLCGQVVSATVGIRAHILESLNSVILNRIGNCNANACVVLMVAGALDLERLVVEEKSLLCIYAEGSEADAGAFGVDNLAVADDLDLERVEVGRVNVPTLRAADGELLIYHSRCRKVAESLCGSSLGYYRLAVKDSRANGCTCGSILAVLKSRLDLNIPGVLASLLEHGLAENSVVRDVELLLCIEADVAVNSRALVPPAFSLKAVDMYRKDVGPSVEVRALAYIKYGLGVRAERTRHKRAVKVKLSVYGSSLKAEEKLLALKRGI